MGVSGQKTKASLVGSGSPQTEGLEQPADGSSNLPRATSSCFQGSFWELDKESAMERRGSSYLVKESWETFSHSLRTIRIRKMREIVHGKPKSYSGKTMRAGAELFLDWQGQGFATKRSPSGALSTFYTRGMRGCSLEPSPSGSEF